MTINDEEICKSDENAKMTRVGSHRLDLNFHTIYRRADS